MKSIYIASFHQTRFGKLMGQTVEQMLAEVVNGATSAIGIQTTAIDCATVGAACNLTLNDQGLVSGLLAMDPGLSGKPIDSAENACASGGQAVLNVIYRILAGTAEVGLAVGYDKMRDAEGKMDGKLVGRALGVFSYMAEREGKTFIFPHIFAEIMRDYMAAYGVTERDLAAIAVAEYANARHNPYAQMRNVSLTLEQAVTIEGINRYIAEGLPLKTYDCSQITDGAAALILASEEGLARLGLSAKDCVRIAGYAQATDPLERAGRNVLVPAGAHAAMRRAYAMAGLAPADVNVAEIHDCFTVMAAIGTEVIGKAEPGLGARYWVEGKAAVGGECGINTSGGLIAKGHPIGATGIAMIGWSAWQLLGKAPAELQVERPRAAATFNIGGPACASVCTVLEPPR